MGMFDCVQCDYDVNCAPLDWDYAEFKQFMASKPSFQTKHLQNIMTTFVIDKSGRLLNERGKLYPYHGEMNFYETYKDKDGNKWWVEFDAVFEDGILSYIYPNPHQTKIMKPAELALEIVNV